MPTTLKGHYCKVQFTMSVSHHKKLVELARAAGVSRSEQIRSLIADAYKIHTGRSSGCA